MVQYPLQNPLASINWFMAGTREKRKKLYDSDGVTFPGKVYSNPRDQGGTKKLFQLSL